MGLFEKKYCSVCGAKIGLLGNRKLEDANLCKNCAARLSPWFTGRRHSTLEEIRAQLEYREQNRSAVDAFHTTRTLGSGTRVYLDEDARRFMVTSARDLKEANPDVLEGRCITDCRLDVSEHKRELRHADKDGRQVSYVPARYEYSYDFYVVLQVNHPYIDEIRFKTNPSSVSTGERSINDTRRGARTWNAEYNEQYTLAETIVSTLLELRRLSREDHTAQELPREAVTCPHCGAPTIPDEHGCCEYCGAALDS